MRAFYCTSTIEYPIFQVHTPRGCESGKRRRGGAMMAEAGAIHALSNTVLVNRAR